MDFRCPNVDIVYHCHILGHESNAIQNGKWAKRNDRCGPLFDEDDDPAPGLRSGLTFCSWETLKREGHTVLAAGDLRQAVDWLNESTPDLLITRNYVASLPGHDAAMYLRYEHPEIRVLMLIGLWDDDRLRYREALQGFDAFPKPYTRAELLEKVKGVLVTPHG